jgi:hypothetical protein
LKPGFLELTGDVDSVVLAGIVRTYYLGIATSSEPDKQWYGFDVYAASVAECNIAIVCACAPSLTSVAGRFLRTISRLDGDKHIGSACDGDGKGRSEKGKTIQLTRL